MASVRSHCIRCDREVEVEYKHSRRMRRLMKGYMMIPIALLPIYPFAASDFMVSLPLIMIYLMGIGPAMAILRDPATCTECGALIPKRPAPSADPANPAA
jgi:hypothetical protein